MGNSQYHQNSNRGILFINTGSPASCAPKDVFNYLIEFLLDPRVIDLPYFARQLLVRGIIVPFRYRKSAKNYAKIWTDEGSPLVADTKKLASSIEKELGCQTAIGMRYGTPSIEEGLKKLREAKIKELIIVPLFPQHASATTSSALEEVMKCLSKWPTIPNVHFVSEFATHPLFLNAWASVGANYNFSSYDHILFSFHGLPERHIKKAKASPNCLLKPSCCQTLCKENFWCYRAQCIATAEGIASRLSIPKENYSICFQSRLGTDSWLKPYTNVTIEALAKKGCKRLCVFAPSFVSDCLETTYEIGMEYQEEFVRLGGDSIDLVPSLNSHPEWINALITIINR